MPTNTTSFDLPAWFPYAHESQTSFRKCPELEPEYDLICSSLNREVGKNWSIQSVDYSDLTNHLPELGTKIVQPVLNVIIAYS